MQKKFLLPLLAFLFMTGGECFASQIIYGNPSATTANVTIPQEYVGMTASFLATGYGYQGGSNMGFSMTLYHPNGTALMTSKSAYVTAGSDAAYDMFPFLYTGTLTQAGVYSFRLGDTYDQKRILSFLCIIWDAQGDDISTLQNNLTSEINDLRGELSGEINTKTAALQGQINTLQTKLNEAILKHNTDQNALLKEIENLKMQISALETDLRTRIAS